MRWTIYKLALHQGRVDGPATPPEGMEVIPASYTDEDVERVAEATWRWEVENPDLVWGNVPDPGKTAYRSLARAALDAYLNG